MAEVSEVLGDIEVGEKRDRINEESGGLPVLEEDNKKMKTSDGSGSVPLLPKELDLSQKPEEASIEARITRPVDLLAESLIYPVFADMLQNQIPDNVKLPLYSHLKPRDGRNIPAGKQQSSKAKNFGDTAIRGLNKEGVTNREMSIKNTVADFLQPPAVRVHTDILNAYKQFNHILFDSCENEMKTDSLPREKLEQMLSYFGILSPDWFLMKKSDEIKEPASNSKTTGEKSSEPVEINTNTNQEEEKKETSLEEGVAAPQIRSTTGIDFIPDMKAVASSSSSSSAVASTSASNPVKASTGVGRGRGYKAKAVRVPATRPVFDGIYSVDDFSYPMLKWLLELALDWSGIYTRHMGPLHSVEEAIEFRNSCSSPEFRDRVLSKANHLESESKIYNHIIAEISKYVDHISKVCIATEGVLTIMASYIKVQSDYDEKLSPLQRHKIEQSCIQPLNLAYESHVYNGVNHEGLSIVLYSFKLAAEVYFEIDRIGALQATGFTPTTDELELEKSRLIQSGLMIMSELSNFGTDVSMLCSDLLEHWCNILKGKSE